MTTKERFNLKNTESPQFSDAAELILDGFEDAFGIVAPRGRENAKQAIINTLAWYCLPNPERCKD